MDKGIIQGLLDAGASMASPGCGPCLGTHAGLLADGEVCITATNRNFPGRMGSAKARIFLASPASVAAAAVAGEITDPRTFLQQGEHDDAQN
jgi:3-isopropylmalate/(R)-2-methylmalate dehydratase large subunit